jgi:hypothetical protein
MKGNLSQTSIFLKLDSTAEQQKLLKLFLLDSYLLKRLDSLIGNWEYNLERCMVWHNCALIS